MPPLSLWRSPCPPSTFYYLLFCFFQLPVFSPFPFVSDAYLSRPNSSDQSFFVSSMTFLVDASVLSLFLKACPFSSALSFLCHFMLDCPPPFLRKGLALLFRPGDRDPVAMLFLRHFTLTDLLQFPPRARLFSPSPWHEGNRRSIYHLFLCHRFLAGLSLWIRLAPVSR